MTTYKLVKVTSQPRRYKWLTKLLGERVEATMVFVPSSVDIDRHINKPDRGTIRQSAPHQQR